ncbi:hypothetical protein [Leptospira sp. GIMC2001]|uniref:hypothetical protein n=1 Tax=Leptospira sp. GIMC2001 TaxID=1513297 RepID=UPI00234A3D87|nr:hypothetical protein [Leptospira sp. GIMC2001]WCL47684.1 hypothetical protein O4O04_00060 [Leptospira sp. GIMC2001]
MNQDKKPLNPLQFFLSILILFVIFLIFLFQRPVPANPETYSYLANLRAVTESGSFFGIDEPLPIMLLYFWKSLFSLNYLTAFQSLAALLFSISLHLLLLLFRKTQWKANHYFLVYLASFLPLSHEFPLTYFNELLGLVFILLIFHTFRMETFLDLLLFPALVIVAFFSDFRMFLLGFSIFTIYQGTKSMQAVRSRTTVFYKRKNIPFIIMISYFSVLAVMLISFSAVDFFSQTSFYDLIAHWSLIIFHLGPCILILAIGNILLGTEKELNTRTFTGILIISIFAVIFYNYSSYDSKLDDQLENIKEDYVRSQSRIQGIGQVYSNPVLSNYLFFQTKIAHKYIGASTREDFSYLHIDDIWQADLNEINKRYTIKRKDRKVELYPLGQKSILISKTIEDRIAKEPETNLYRKKLEDTIASMQEKRPFLNFLRWQQRFIGYSNSQY